MSYSGISLIVAVGVVIGAAVTISIQRNNHSNLARENEQLRSQLQQSVTATTGLKEQLTALASARDNDPRQAELARLRGEVTRLHGLERELNQLRAQSAQREQNPKPEAVTTPKVDSNQQDSLALFTRVYKVNPETLKAHLQKSAIGTNTATNLQDQVRHLLQSAGVELQPPRNVFFNEDTGALMVRTTLADLDVVESVIQVMSEKASKP